MSSLRWILAVAGLLLIVGIVVWGRMRRMTASENSAHPTRCDANTNNRATRESSIRDLPHPEQQARSSVYRAPTLDGDDGRGARSDDDLAIPQLDDAVIVRARQRNPSVIVTRFEIDIDTDTDALPPMHAGAHSAQQQATEIESLNIEVPASGTARNHDEFPTGTTREPVVTSLDREEPVLNDDARLNDDPGLNEEPMLSEEPDLSMVSNHGLRGEPKIGNVSDFAQPEHFHSVNDLPESLVDHAMTSEVRAEPKLNATPTMTATAVTASASASPRPTKRPVSSRKIVALRLSTGASRIEGSKLKDLLEHAALTHGKYSIYHRLHTDGSALFSVASMVEPGTFDPQTMSAIQYPGVTLFMQLPGPVDGNQMFAEMLSCARQLEQGVSGILQDERGLPLTEVREHRLRDDVADFLHLLG